MKKNIHLLIIIFSLSAITAIGLTKAKPTQAANPAAAAEIDKHNDHNDHDEHEEHEEHDEHQAPTESGHEGHGHEDEQAAVTLSPAQIQLAEIRTEVLEARIIPTETYTPGELKANAYSSYLVSPRIDSVVLKRHAALGDHVQKGQPLVTLFAEAVAEAQADYMVTRAEWLRVKKMGRLTVGAKRYIQAEMDYKAAYSRLKIFGLNEAAIKNMAAGSTVLGEYTLTAAISGAVLSDDFQQGQRVEAGTALMKLADEHNLWVEAYLAPNLKIGIDAGVQARIKVDNKFFPAVVSQQEHTIDPLTRTRTLRLVVDNDKRELHPGLFVDVYFSTPSQEPILAVPETALLRGSDGDWTIFIEENPGEYQVREVTRGRSFGELREISGIAAGSKVVIEGAFFVASQLSKGGFDPHNH